MLILYIKILALELMFYTHINVNILDFFTDNKPLYCTFLYYLVIVNYNERLKINL